MILLQTPWTNFRTVLSVWRLLVQPTPSVGISVFMWESIFLSGLLTYAFAALLIHEADPESRPVVITISHVVSFRPYVTFQDLAKQNKLQARIVIATGRTAGLAEWINDSTHCIVFHVSFSHKLHRPWVVLLKIPKFFACPKNFFGHFST